MIFHEVVSDSLVKVSVRSQWYFYRSIVCKIMANSNLFSDTFTYI